MSGAEDPGRGDLGDLGELGDIAAIALLSDQHLAQGGFLGLRRSRVRNQRRDGSFSAAYTIDVVERAHGTDAVVVLPFQRDPLRVVLRCGLRPALSLGRRAGQLRRGKQAPLMLVEAVAGIVEQEDQGDAGLLRRAALELAEEVGITVDPAAVCFLGAPAFLSPGAMAEQLFFCAVECDLAQRGAIRGDGGVMEEGGAALCLTLEQALAACARGEIADVKSECILRRLAAHCAE